MISNDLLSYSIIHGGNKVVPAMGKQLVPLLIKDLPPPIDNRGKGSITLPPLNIKSNGTLNIPTYTLTENNLMHLRSTYQGDENNSNPPSLTSASSVCSASPLSSPNLSRTDLTEMPVSNESYVKTKRRQRLGPSCDSCRARKVKCNAEIEVLCKIEDNTIPMDNETMRRFSKTEIDDLVFNDIPIVYDNSTNIIKTNNKIIKFKRCSSCVSKHSSCYFSKGFTKEDIMINKKSFNGVETSPIVKIENASNCKKSKASKIVKKKATVPNGPTNSRKSSCTSCRKRKVKCVYNNILLKCEGCYKKNHECSFESVTFKSNNIVNNI